MPSMSTFRSFRNRPAPWVGMRCRVYRNLNRPTLFSIVADEGTHKGRVLGYAPVVALTDVQFKVQAAGYERLHRTKVRNVHAMAIGRFKSVTDTLPEALMVAARITYHPFRQPYFFDRADPGTPVRQATEAWAYGPDLLVPTPTEATPCD